MPRLTELAHLAVRELLAPGETAIDATAGNGRDTLFLARVVGPGGRVFAFDVQEAALGRTAQLLFAAGVRIVTLILGDHAGMARAIPAEFRTRVGAVMFNLGYRPGGEKSLVTRPESTVPAIETGLALLRPGGVLTVVAYPDHTGGADEADAVRAFLRRPAPACRCRESASAGGPVLFVARKLSPSGDRGPADGPGQ
jgi:predicted methyltransferase